MQIDRAAILDRAFRLLRQGEVPSAREILRSEYPFVPVAAVERRYTVGQALAVFQRDGFIDRYSGERLVFPGIFRLFSRVFPLEFPYQVNWKMEQTHPAYWELFPTIDHIDPVARGGLNTEENWVTTSMLRNAAKANWKLDELGWSLRPKGSLTDWDGLTKLFVDFVRADPAVLDDKYLQRWYSAAVAETPDAKSSDASEEPTPEP